MRRVSSALRGRAAPADASLPLISTSGGFPGEKKRSLTLAEVRSMAANRSGVGVRTGAGATAAALAAAAPEAGAAAAAAGTAILGGRIVGEDISKVQFVPGGRFLVRFGNSVKKRGSKRQRKAVTAQTNLSGKPLVKFP